MARRPYKALGIFTTTAGMIIIRKVFSRQQATWILICEGPHAGLRHLLPEWMPRGPSTRTQISPPKPITKVSGIIAFYHHMAPIFSRRLEGTSCATVLPKTQTPSYRTLGELLQVVRREAETSLRAGSVETYNHQWVALMRVLDPGQALADLGRGQLQAAMGTLSEKYAASTVRNLRTALNKLLIRAVEDRVLPSNPLEKVRIPKVITKTKRMISFEQRAAVLAEAAKRGQDAHLLFGLLLLAGLRRREVLSIAWDRQHIDLEHRVLTVANDGDFTTKSGSGRSIPICQELLEILTRYHHQTGFVLAPNKPYSGGRWRWNFTKIFASVVREAGVPWMHCHLCRHVFSSHYMEQGGSIFRLARILGHASTAEVTEQYLHLLPGFASVGDLSTQRSIPA